MVSYPGMDGLKFFISRDDVVEEVSDLFCQFTELDKADIVGISLNKLFHDLLRMEIDHDLIVHEAESFLFTKSFQARHVSIKKLESETHQQYIIDEMPNSRFEGRNQHLEQLLHENVIGIGVYTSGFRLLKANQTYLNYLPTPYNLKETAYGKSLSEMFHNFDGNEGGSVLWNNIIEEKKSVYIQEKYGLLLNDDHYFWDNTITPIIENGQVKYLVSMLSNVTGKVFDGEVVKAQKAKYEAIMDNMSDALLVIDKDCDIVHFNKTFHDFMAKYNINYPNEKLYDENGMEIIGSELPANKLINGMKTQNQRLMIKKDQNNIYFECNGNQLTDDNGKLQMGILSFRDVTQVVENEKRIELQNQQLEALFNHMPEGLIILDSKGFIHEMNHNALRILGLQETEVFYHRSDYISKYIMKDIVGNILPLERWPLSRALSKERFSNLEMWMHYNDQDRTPCLLSFAGTPVYDDNGDVTYAIITFRDITEQRAIQETLINTIKEKNAALKETMAFKDEYLYLITHEMKTPLAVISTALQAMNLVCGQLPGKTAKYIKTIKQNTNRQLRLVNNLLDIIRLNTGKIKLNNEMYDIVSLTDLIVKSVLPIAIQQGIGINFNSEIRRRFVLTDEEKIERILLNLLSNALKFTPANKEVNVKVFCRRINNDDFVCISIKDQGIGIPKEKHPVIFEQFGQANTSDSRPAEGTGIGLYLVKKMLDAMGGFIILSSEEGVGSDFTIMLPDQNTILNEMVKDQRADIANDRLTRELEIHFSDIYY